MKPTYSGFEAKKKSNFAQLPPAGAYVGEIQGVRVDKSYDGTRDEIVLMLEITEGDYTNQYHKVFTEQQNSFGSDVKYKGTFKLRPYIDGDEAWIKTRFEGNLWCIQESNPGYAWDWDEKKLKGKKVGFSVRNREYTGNDGKQRRTTEIGQLETVDDVRNGKCKPLKDRVQQNSNPVEMVETGGTDVTGEVEVPF